MAQNELQNVDLNLRQIFKTIWHGKYFIAFAVLSSLVLLSVYLRKTEPEYTVSMTIKPVVTSLNTSSAANFSTLSSIAGINIGNEELTDFKQFEIMLKTEEIAEKLFEDQKYVKSMFGSEWDQIEKKYRQPKLSALSKIKNILKRILTGSPQNTYIEPNPSRLAIQINKLISIKAEKSGLLFMEAESANPFKAILTMMKLIETTDLSMKKKFIAQGNQALSFYYKKITNARSKEHRAALAKLIAREEQKLMLATRDGAFVAEVMSGPKTSLYPTKPDISKLIAMYIILSFIAATALILIKANLFEDV